MIAIATALWWLKNSSIARLGLGALAIVGGLWGLVAYGEHKGVEKQIVHQEQVDKTAVVKAEKARAVVRKAKPKKGKPEKSDGWRRD